MKISELIRKLEYELKSTGDSDIYVSIDTSKYTARKIGGVVFTNADLVTGLDVSEKETKFIIKNWVM